MAGQHQEFEFVDVVLAGRSEIKGYKLQATAEATLEDVMAAVGSDAIWLRTDYDELGDCVSDAPHTLVSALDKTKILAIVPSCVRGGRPGHPDRVKLIPPQ